MADGRKNEQGQVLFEFSRMGFADEVRKILGEYNNVDEYQDYSGQTALIVACLHNRWF